MDSKKELWESPGRTMKIMGYIRKHPRLTCYIFLWIAVLVLNVIAWKSTAFCDGYIAWIFPVWVNTYGRVTGWFPFSVGEWMLVAAVALVILVLLHGLLRVVAGFCAVGKTKDRLCRWCKGFFLFSAWVAAGVALVMTLNCTILYHGSSLADRCFTSRQEPYTLEELTKVRNLVVEKCNELAMQMPRDEQGNIIYTGSYDRQGNPVDLEEQAILIMQKLGSTYSQFDGYYPRPKAMFFSDFMCQQYMQGYYFPFSLEANYNDVMCFINKPATLCHELVHLRGYIYEDEANFLSYVACTESEDLFFRYSGYLSVLYYLDNDFYRAVGRDYDRYSREPAILPVVHWDTTFVSEEEWERINGESLIDTEVVEAASDTFVDTSLKLNGVKDGKISYSRVVELLLRYYLDGQ